MPCFAAVCISFKRCQSCSSGAAVDAYIVFNGDNAREKVCYLVHAYLKDVLGHLQADRHAQELVPAMMCVKSGQVGRLLKPSFASSLLKHVALLSQ